MQKDNLDSIVDKESQKELSRYRKLKFVYKAGFTFGIYEILDNLFDGRYTEFAATSTTTAILGLILIIIHNKVKKNNSGNYIPIPSLTIPIGILFGSYALNELYHSLLKGPWLNP